MRVQRATDGTFSTVWNDQSRLDLIRQVFERAAVARLSMSAYNRVLAELKVERPGLVSAPSAEAMHLHFNRLGSGRLSWEQIVGLALSEPGPRVSRLTVAGRLPMAPYLGEDHVFFALRRVARVAGVDTLAPYEYMRGRDEQLRRDARRGGLLRDLLPTEGQITTICGDWKRALDLAGLQPLVRRLPRRTAVAPRRGLPLADAIVLFCAVNGRFPGLLLLGRFAEACGFAVETVDTYSDAVEAARELLALHGLPVPAERPVNWGKVRRWEYPRDGVPGAPARDSVGSPGFYTRELCIVALRVWDLELAATGKRTQKRYLAWQIGSEWPAPKVFSRYGGLTALRAEAFRANAERLAEGCKPQAVLVELLAHSEALLTEARQRALQGAPDFSLAAAIAAVASGPREVGYAGSRRERLDAGEELPPKPRHSRAKVRSEGAAKIAPPPRAGRPAPKQTGPRTTARPTAKTARAAGVPLPGATPSARRPRVSIDDLVDARLLSQAETLVATYYSKRYEAELIAAGTVSVAGIGQAPSISAAARLIVGRDQDGWRFWGVERDGTWIPLKTIADIYRAHATGRS